MAVVTCSLHSEALGPSELQCVSAQLCAEVKPPPLPSLCPCVGQAEWMSAGCPPSSLAPLDMEIRDSRLLAADGGHPEITYKPN